MLILVAKPFTVGLIDFYLRFLSCIDAHKLASSLLLKAYVFYQHTVINLLIHSVT